MVDLKIRNYSSYDEACDYVALVFCDFIAVFLKKINGTIFYFLFFLGGMVLQTICLCKSTLLLNFYKILSWWLEKNHYTLLKPGERQILNLYIGKSFSINLIMYMKSPKCYFQVTRELTVSLRGNSYFPM